MGKLEANKKRKKKLFIILPLSFLQRKVLQKLPYQTLWQKQVLQRELFIYIFRINMIFETS